MVIELDENKIFSKSNLLAFDLKPWITRKLVVLITGVKKKTTDEEKETIDWIKIPLQRFYVKMVTEQLNCTILDVDESLSLVFKKLEIIYRPNLDLKKSGVLVEGDLPFIHIHLGHGDKKIWKESEISKDESGKSVYFKSSDYLHHLDKADGKCWMGAFPFCNGSDFASEASKSKRIHATWGSVDESPVTGLEALFELPYAIAQDYRVFRILSRAIEANTL